MKKLVCILILWVVAVPMAFVQEPVGYGKRMPSLLPQTQQGETTAFTDSLYNAWHLSSYQLSKEVFTYAYTGYQYLLHKQALKKTHLLTICDYSKPSTARRLYVLNIETGELLFHSLVSHGKKSGGLYATSFSNSNSSHKSSLGFMVTADTYYGKAGYSLHFDGVEKGFNDQVRNRAIVMHGSYYVNDWQAEEGTAVGRSYGCPAVPYAMHSVIINEIKGGSCFFVYHPSPMYLHRSKVLNSKFTWPVLMAKNGNNGATSYPSLSSVR